MKLYEHEGKALFAQSEIAVPNGRVVSSVEEAVEAFRQINPCVLKAQVLWGSRGKAQAIIPCDTEKALIEAFNRLFGSKVHEETVECLLLEERLQISREYYLSVTYREHAPTVLASTHGGTDVVERLENEPEAVLVEPVNILQGMDREMARTALTKAGFREDDAMQASAILMKLYDFFISNDALLAEINPLIKTTSGQWVAADAKVEIDDDALYRNAQIQIPERLSSGRKPTHLESLALKNEQMDTSGAAGKMFYEIPGGNIVVLASGGGTSVEALDNLCLLGGKPAVFTEYSGNPSAEKVKGLTQIALMTDQPIDGVWVIGGRANFTDIYETLVSGVLEGIRATEGFDRTIPIVVRRAGPRDEEAFGTLRKAREEEGYNILVRGMGTSVSESARMMISQARKHEQTRVQRKS